MSNSRTLIPSPARSQGAPMTPRRYVTPRKTRSVCSPARSTASGRLSTLIQEHREQDKSTSVLSPIVRRSLLPDNTDIEVPGRKSWWNNLKDQSRDVIEVLKENVIEPHNIMDELNIEVLSQEENKRYTLDLPDSSDCESIHSIVIPRKTLFNQKENRPQKQYNDYGNRGTLEKVFQPNADPEKPTSTGTKELLQNKPMTKPAFPAALLDVSANTTVGDKTLAPASKPTTGLRNMFGTQQATKRKNMFAKFIECTTDYSSEEDIADISKVQRKFFDLPKPVPQRRTSVRSSSSKLQDPSPTSNDMADSFADWDHLPSSTLVDNQLEAALTGGNKAKRSRLSKLSEATSPLTSNSSKSSNKSLKNKSQIKDKSLENIVDIPQNISLALKYKEAKQIITSKIKHQNLQNDQNKVINDSIEISLKNNYNKSLINEEEAVTEIIVMDVDEKQTEEQEFQEIAGKDKNTTKQTLNVSQTKSIEKSIKKNEETVVISSKINAMEKLDEIINQDVDMEVHVSQDASMNKDQEKNHECENENVPRVPNEELHSQSNRTKTNEEEHINKNLEMDNLIDKSQIVNEATVVENEILKSQIESESNVESVANVGNVAKETNQNINAVSIVLDNENLEQNNKNDLKNTQDERNQSKEIEEETKINESQKETKVGEENITEEQNESVIDNQEMENDHSDQEEEENENDIDEQEVHKNESEIEQTADDNESDKEEQEADENESEMEEENVDENEVEEEDQDNEDNNRDVVNASEVDEHEMTPEASDQSIEATVDSDLENYQESEQEQINESNQESAHEDINESQHGSDNEEVNESNQESANEDINESKHESDNEEEVVNESDREPEAEQVNTSDQEMETDQNDDDAIDNTLIPDISHDTTGRNRKKPDNVSIEAVVFRPTKELEHSFVSRARNTTVRKSNPYLSLINPHIEPEKMQENNTRGSLSMSEGKNSNAEGSGWDSHKITRKTLRQTFGKDFTPRKSLRALVMEKSAKIHTLAKGNKDITSGNIPLANSTELGEASMGHDYEMQEESLEPVHDVSIRTRKATLEEYLIKIKRENDQRRAQIAEAVKKQLEQPPKVHTFKVPAQPTFPRRTQAKGPGQAKVATNIKLKLSVPLEDLPADFQEDLKYKPPKRFAPRNAAWLTKRFYKYVESKLEPKYDYKARVRAEKFAQTLYNFVQANRRRNVALSDHVDELKHEMARLKIVKTHFEFYNFFWDFMPREVRLKVIPDLTNKIPQPRTGIFSDILESDMRG